MNLNAPMPAHAISFHSYVFLTLFFLAYLFPMCLRLLMIPTFLFYPHLLPRVPFCLIIYMSMFSPKACVMVLIPIPSFDCVFHGPALPYTRLLQSSSKIKTKRAKKNTI